jgi:hypothetical protein
MQPGSGGPGVVSGRGWALRSQRSGYESQATGKETQHQEGIEQRCWLEVQVQVGDDAGENDERTPARNDGARRVFRPLLSCATERHVLLRDRLDSSRY